MMLNRTGSYQENPERENRDRVIGQILGSLANQDVDGLPELEESDAIPEGAGIRDDLADGDYSTAAAKISSHTVIGFQETYRGGDE